LVVAEKPDAARRIAAALSGSSADIESCPEFIVCRGKTNYVIVPAVGHVFALAPSYPKRDVHPVLDLRWVPLSSIDKKRKDIDRRIQAFRSLCGRASKLVIACDFDTEGDTIGYNILKHACGIERVKAFRARFSTLTDEELRESFAKLVWQESWPMAEAGLTRHFLDFVWGVNLSRALTESLLTAGGGYATLSIGRVQGPTLSYVFDRELEVRTHVPIPFWRVRATLDVDGRSFSADYSIHRIDTEVKAAAVKHEVEGRDGVVTEAERKAFAVPPPPPFNLGDLQHEAFRTIGLSPSRTLVIAEKLYLQAAISYPRTSSQQIPSSIGYERILKALSNSPVFRSAALSALGGSLNPVQGQKSDSAHPAIFPTGQEPHDLDVKERELYELITRRFLSSFSVPAIKERHAVRVECGGHEFHASTIDIKSPGWMAIWGYEDTGENQGLPPVRMGEAVNFRNVDVIESFDLPPSRYNQNTLLQAMEDDNIGTKATRAEVISTVLERGYIIGGSMELSELGFTVVECMSKYSPDILSTEMTKSIERELDEIERGSRDPDSVSVAGVEQLLSCLRLLGKNLTDVGSALSRANVRTSQAKAVLGPCPSCDGGKLIMIRSRRTGKRFVGCTNYSKGCRASAPLPQKGLVRATSRPCESCGWPVVMVSMAHGRKPWRLCVNPNCPTKKASTHETPPKEVSR